MIAARWRPPCQIAPCTGPCSGALRRAQAQIDKEEWWEGILRLLADPETAPLVTGLLKFGGGIARLGDEAWLRVSAAPQR